MGLLSDLKSKVSGKLSANDNGHHPDHDELRARLGSLPPFDPAKAQVFRYRKQYGVNLGSMFCLEPWMATGIYKEYHDQGPEAEGDLLECMGDCCGEKMKAHWDSWLVRADFERMSNIGINAVRLPLGYWVLGRGFAAGKYKRHAATYDEALHYVGRVVAWAAEFDIGVLVDIHALPGGQNFDSHSGATGPPQFFDSRKFQDLAIKCYEAFTHLFASVTNVVGLQIVNEPVDNPQLEGFYERALTQVRSQSLDLPVYVGDGWNLAKYAAVVKRLRERFGFIVVDTHQYWVFRPEEQQYRVDQLTRELWETTVPELSQASNELGGNLIVGEYSSVLANGSFDGEDPAKCMGAFAREQLNAFDQVAAGTWYWTWRLQHDSWFWSMQYAINAGAMPPAYFPFGWTPSTAVSREDVVNTANTKREEWREKRLEGHKSYVSQWKGEFGFDHYAAGFDKGLDAALKFFSQLGCPSKVGFVRQLASEHAAEYVAQHGHEQWKWEFEDGFREAIEEFNDYCQSLDFTQD
ncbi:Glucan 1,3-beta-glucosidase 3 [Coemansia sp. RSA 2708]|nr:Glucan 1,3-beta-glucosidase 3 [Coemansia sp. RSA 2708]